MGVASRSSKLPTEQRSSLASLRYMGKNEIKQMRIFVLFFLKSGFNTYLLLLIDVHTCVCVYVRVCILGTWWGL